MLLRRTASPPVLVPVSAPVSVLAPVRAPAAPTALAARRRLRGTTLMELIVVLIVLSTIAGLLVANVGTASASAPHDGTLASLAAARDAILGPPHARHPSGYLADVGALPLQMRDLFMRPPAVGDFSPSTGRGWRGPYFSTSTGAYEIDAPELDPPPGFTPVYGSDNDPAVLDGWGAALVLQIPDAEGDGPSETDLRHARLLSAGPDGQIDTPRTDAEAVLPGTAYYPLQSQCDDDLLLYLRVADLRSE